VNHLVITYGYFAVALFVGMESLGIPLPGETILVAAGTYAGHTHRLSVWALFAVSAAAAIVGDNIGYLLGRKGGSALVRRYGHYVRLDEAKIKVGRYLFDLHGGKVVFFGRFVSVLRTYAAFLAGTNLMEWPRFLVYNAAGGIVWSATYAFASYELGAAFQKVSSTIYYVLIGVAVAAAVAVVITIRRQLAKLTARAEAAYPGTEGAKVTG